MSRRPAVVLAACALLLASSAAAQVTLPMTSHEAYLRIDPTDTASPALIVPLAAYGFEPGQTLRIEPQGEYDNGPGADAYKAMMAVFSASATLLANNLVTRVPGAVEGGIDYITHTTCPGNYATDITQDFTVDDAGVDVVIPPGAAYLFLAPRECYYVDNSDPDGDYGVRLTKVILGIVPGTPTALSLAPARPTPASSLATVAFALPVAGHVRLTLHDLAGRQVATLVDAVLPAGPHEAAWGARDPDGRRVPAGIYFMRLVTAQGERTSRLVLAR